MNKWAQSLLVGLAVAVIYEFLSGRFKLYLHLPGLCISAFAGIWLASTCIFGIPAVLIHRKFFRKEKKEESGKVE